MRWSAERGIAITAFSARPLEDVVTFLRELSAVEIRAAEAVAEVKVELRLEQIPLRTVLGLIAAQHGLELRFDDKGALHLERPQQPAEKQPPVDE